jgi:hypothetical protein
VKRRKSDDQSTAAIASPLPRRILTGQHLASGVRSKIGLEHVFRDLLLAVHVGDDRQPLRHHRKVGDLALGKPARPACDIGRHIGPRPKGAPDRKRKIIGRAARLQIVQDGKVQPCIRPFQSPPQDFAVPHPRHRILRGRNKIGNLMRDHDLLGLRAGAPPDIDGAQKLRMQRAATQADPQHGHARCHEPPRQFVDRSCERTDLPGPAAEPFDDRTDGVMAGPLGDCALDHLRDDDIAAFHDK